MGHDHHADSMGDRRLVVAVVVNVLLTVAQIIGGLLSGSLSLVADAIHNLSDAGSLAIALFARKIGRKSPDELMTFGYKRAEIIATLINLVTLVIIGLYLIYEAIWRLVMPESIEGWMVVIVAGIALVVDVTTALLTYKMSKTSMNIKAAFIHNLSDAMASVGVIVAGTLIILYEWHWVDTVATFVISGYILYQAFKMLPGTIHILMEGMPEGITRENVKTTMEQINHVINVHDIHVWQIAEHRFALVAHVVIDSTKLEEMEAIKQQLKVHLRDTYTIEHSTLEFEAGDSALIHAMGDPDAPFEAEDEVGNTHG